MTIQFSRRGMAARPTSALKARSSLGHRLVRAHDDPGKQRIRAWLRELDGEQLTSLGITAEDILVLRHLTFFPFAKTVPAEPLFSIEIIPCLCPCSCRRIGS